MTQPRIATGSNQEGHFELHLLKNVYGHSGDVELETAEDARCMTKWPLYAEDIGIVEIICPAMMWGSPEEILSDMEAKIYERLRAAGIIYLDGAVYFAA